MARSAGPAIWRPCYIGKLTFLMPRKQHLQCLVQVSKTVSETGHQKRATVMLNEKCDDNVVVWGKVLSIAGSLFLPQLSSIQALQSLHTLACWAGKQMNKTSEILYDLASDLDSVRHATLQNRAAIDFFLLAHGHGCEEFAGMCCMNLSDHSQSIHKKLQELMNNMRKL